VESPRPVKICERTVCRRTRQLGCTCMWMTANATPCSYSPSKTFVPTGFRTWHGLNYSLNLPNGDGFNLDSETFFLGRPYHVLNCPSDRGNLSGPSYAASRISYGYNSAGTGWLSSGDPIGPNGLSGKHKPVNVAPRFTVPVRESDLLVPADMIAIGDRFSQLSDQGPAENVKRGCLKLELKHWIERRLKTAQGNFRT